MKQLFGGVYAAATLGQVLREFTHGTSYRIMDSSGFCTHPTSVSAVFGGDSRTENRPI